MKSHTNKTKGPKNVNKREGKKKEEKIGTCNKWRNRERPRARNGDRAK